MQFNFYFLKWLSPTLKKQLKGFYISSIFSQCKNELVIKLEQDDRQFIIHANLSSEAYMLSFPKTFARAKKNSVDLFKSSYGLKVTDVKQFENERSFIILLSQDQSLLFKLHGRYANILLYKGNKVVSLFKNYLLADQNLDIKSLNKSLNHSKEQLIKTSFDLFQSFPTFDKHIKNHLKAVSFDTSSSNQKWNIISKLITQLNEGKFYLVQHGQQVKLTLLKSENIVATYSDPIEASNELSKRYFSQYSYHTKQNQLLKVVNKDIKKCNSYLKIANDSLQSIIYRRSHSELADILMANLHQTITPKQTKIKLYDFYQNTTIQIKLKTHTSLQKNAEQLYRKAKNQSKESNVLTKNIEEKKVLLKQLEEKKEAIKTAKDYKSLKSFDTNEKKKLKKIKSLFLEFKIDTYQVWLGRNAKNNDLLTQKYAHKEDLWLHARDVSGSHTIIRNPQGNPIPISIIEKVAQLAAWHSKRKSDTLCPVIYTPKKYVRKPKGNLPGQVLITREKVILVKPNKKT